MEYLRLVPKNLMLLWDLNCTARESFVLFMQTANRLTRTYFVISFLGSVGAPKESSFNEGQFGFCLFQCMSDAVLACPVSWTPLHWTTLCTKKSNHDAPTHTISGVGLVSSNDLVETVAFVVLNWQCIIKKCFFCTKRSSLNRVVVVVLVVSSVNTHRIVTLICDDWKNACLGCHGLFQTCHFTVEVFGKQPTS